MTWIVQLLSSLGKNGSLHVTDGNTDQQDFPCTVIEMRTDTVVFTSVDDTTRTGTLLTTWTKGERLYGKITGFKLVSGSVVAYT